MLEDEELGLDAKAMLKGSTLELDDSHRQSKLDEI